MLKEEFPKVEEIKNKKAVDKNIFISIEEEFEWPSLESKIGNKKGYCHGLNNQIAILVDGTVIPCCLDHQGIINLGNIYKQDMESILNNKKAMEIQEGFRNRKVVEKLCQKCQYKEKFSN